MLKYMTAGESHGEALVAVIEGMPAGLVVADDDINIELARRQKGYGRGARMNIETDTIKCVSGIRWGETTGAPISMMVLNKDYKNCIKLMSRLKKDFDKSLILLKPRPGHADLAGMLKYARADFRDILERASARETAMRVGVGALAKKLLREFGIEVRSHVVQVGSVRLRHGMRVQDIDWDAVEQSPVRCADKKTETQMIGVIKKAMESGDTIGGVFQVVVRGCPVGLGSHVSAEGKLDARIAAALVSIQAVKGVEFGGGFSAAVKLGSKYHDEIFYSKQKGFYRNTNMAGGFEGGITNGQDVLAQAVMKPIASLKKPLKTVNLGTMKPDRGEIVRSDACAVGAAGIVGEAAVAWEVARALKEKFGGDSLIEMKSNFENYLEQIKKLEFLQKRHK